MATVIERALEQATDGWLHVRTIDGCSYDGRVEKIVDEVAYLYQNGQLVFIDTRHITSCKLLKWSTNKG